jgi:hypothetical protein
MAPKDRVMRIFKPSDDYFKNIYEYSFMALILLAIMGNTNAQKPIQIEGMNMIFTMTHDLVVTIQNCMEPAVLYKAACTFIFLYKLEKRFYHLPI